MFLMFLYKSFVFDIIWVCIQHFSCKNCRSVNFNTECKTSHNIVQIITFTLDHKSLENELFISLMSCINQIPYWAVSSNELSIDLFKTGYVKMHIQ